MDGVHQTLIPLTIIMVILAIFIIAVMVYLSNINKKVKRIEEGQQLEHEANKAVRNEMVNILTILKQR